MSGETQLFVDQKIKRRKIVLWAKKYSPMSHMVHEILKSYEIPAGALEVCEIDRRHDCAHIESYFLTICLASQREVPRLFVNCRYIASGHEILRLHETGELAEILQPITLGNNDGEPEL